MVGSAVPTYDANGNLTNDTSHSYSWDTDGNMLKLDPGTSGGVCDTYDALDRMVEKATGTSCTSSYTEIVYSPTGARLATMTGQSLQQASVPLLNGSEALYTATGLLAYRHPDHLGSSRFASTSTRTKYYDGAYAPYGEDYADSGTTDLSFTEQREDSSSWLYDFQFRKYNTAHGRWMSPDPAGLAAIDPVTPQTWNRYSYALNNPLLYIDPLGLWCVFFADSALGGFTLNCGNDGSAGNSGTKSPQSRNNGENAGGAANTGTISAGTLDQLNDYCSARGRAKFIADWLPGGGTIARTLWGSHNGDQLGFYQLSTADLNNITGENSGGQTVALHAASEGLKTAAGSTAFLSWFRGATGVPKTLASTWLGRVSLALIVADASSGFYKEGKEILNCQAGN